MEMQNFSLTYANLLGVGFGCWLHESELFCFYEKSIVV